MLIISGIYLAFALAIRQDVFGTSALSLLQISEHFDGLSLPVFELRLDLLHDVHDHLIRRRRDLVHEEHVATERFHAVSSCQIVEFAVHHYV